MHDGMIHAHIYNEPQHEKGYTYEYSNERGGVRHNVMKPRREHTAYIVHHCIKGAGGCVQNRTTLNGT